MALPQPHRMSGDVVPNYVRHKSEQTLLYQLVEQYWPEFQTPLGESGRFLPRHITREFQDYLTCGRLENGFLRVRCDSCSHEHLVTFSCKHRGFSPKVNGQLRFHRVNAPSIRELDSLVATISERKKVDVIVSKRDQLSIEAQRLLPFPPWSIDPPGTMSECPLDHYRQVLQEVVTLDSS